MDLVTLENTALYLKHHVCLEISGTCLKKTRKKCKSAQMRSPREDFETCISYGPIQNQNIL